MSKEIKQDRRHFLGTAAMTIAAAEFAFVASARAQSGANTRDAITTKPGTHTSFGSLKQIEAGVLNVGYAEAGPANGAWSSCCTAGPTTSTPIVDVAPLLASAGYRVLVPYLARLWHDAVHLEPDRAQWPALGARPRHGRVHGCAQDSESHVGGCDWGARTANIVAALWPERCKAMVSVSGYLIGNQEAGKVPLPPEAEFQWWYQYYFSTERGREGYEKYRHDFAKLIWQTRLAEVELRRRHVRPQCGVLRQSGSRQHHDPQLSVATRTGRRRSQVRRIGKAPGGRAGHRVPTITLEGDANGAPHPTPAPTRRSSPESTHTGPSPGVSVTTCHRKRRRPLRRR